MCVCAHAGGGYFSRILNDIGISTKIALSEVGSSVNTCNNNINKDVYKRQVYRIYAGHL